MVLLSLWKERYFTVKAQSQSKGGTGCLQTGLRMQVGSHECAARSGPRAFMVRGVRVSGHGGLRDTPGKRPSAWGGHLPGNGQRTALL